MVNRKRSLSKRGSKNGRWRGGKSKATNGYITVPAPELGPGGRRKYAHRAKTGAPRAAVVHHKNHKRSDNRRSNLVVTRKHPGAGRKYGKRK